MNAQTVSGLTSVILPAYNRAGFLADAFASVRAQTDDRWELVVVDDGSTDDTKDVVGKLSHGIEDRVRYYHQANAGAYAARNTGVRHARGEYIAFFDSDDLWLPHHIADGAEALRTHSELDWVYSACRRVDFRTGRVLQADSFCDKPGRRRPFLQLRTRANGKLRIFDDPNVVVCQLDHGLYCGLQASVIRKQVFADMRFDPRSRVVEDVMFLIRALKAGTRVGYLDDVHVVYRVHDDNSSSSSPERSEAKQRGIFTEMVEGYERILSEVPLTRSERRALRRRLGQEYFWHLGYSTFWRFGRRHEAIRAYKQGLRWWPWNVRCWKTFLLALSRTSASREVAPS